MCVEPSVGVSSGPYGTPKFWFQDAVQDAAPWWVIWAQRQNTATCTEIWHSGAPAAGD